MSVYHLRRGLYWDDFAAFLRRNVAYNAQMKIYPPSKLQPKMVTLCDLSLPRRQGLIDTGNYHTDVLRDSQVVNLAWYNGMCPYKNWDKRRGIRSGLDILLAEGTLIKTDEVKDLMEASTWYE